MHLKIIHLLQKNLYSKLKTKQKLFAKTFDQNILTENKFSASTLFHSLKFIFDHPIIVILVRKNKHA